MIAKITHITLFVDNQEEALTFYKKLGFNVHTDAQFGQMRWLTLHLPEQKDVELVLMLAETAEEKSLVGKQSASKPFLSLESASIFNDFAQLKDAGITILENPEEQPWGISGMIQDPVGNRIYICQSN